MKNKYGKRLTNKFVNKVVSTSVIYTIGYICFYLVARFICNQFIWQPDNIVYQILSNIAYNLFFLVFVWLIGIVIIFIVCLRKVFSYIDSIVTASELLAQNNQEWIKLPTDLVEIEERMNFVKQQSLHLRAVATEEAKRKNDLIIYLAHDIKTPLTSMIGYLSLLDEIDDMPIRQRKKYIKIALDKSYRLEELINELFDITRFNSETIVLEKEEIDLSLMLEQIVDDFYPMLKEEHKQIKITAPKKLLLEADSAKLARVFNNIIKNAIYYSEKNSNITVEVKAEGQFVFIIISNKGKKIPAEKLSKIFEKFYRLDQARSTNTGGSGLGLAIAKEIVQLHQGTISATSDDEYTKFYIKLPR